MIEFERKVGTKGQVVIPKEMRNQQNIKPHSKVLFSFENQHIVIKSKKTSLSKKLKKENQKKIGKKDFDKEFYKEIEKEVEK